MSNSAPSLADQSDADMQDWQRALSPVAPSAAADSLSPLLTVYYQKGRSGKERIIGLFRDKPDAVVFPALEQAIRNNADSNIRNAAMEIVIALKGRSVPPLLRFLRDADEEVRTFAGVMLGDIKDRAAVPDLVAALADPDLNVKHAAAEALGKIGDERAVDALINALGTDMWLQFPAAVALGELGSRRAIGPLLAMLDTPGANIPAIQALGKIGDPVALEHLGRFLEDEEPSLREWALEAVSGLLARTPAAADHMRISGKTADILTATLASESRKARRNAAIVLGCCKVKAAVARLTKLLADRDLREDALDALVRIGGEGALAELTSYTKDSDPLLRRAAVTALAGIGTERSMKAILPLLADAVEEVRAEAALALSRFNNEDARRALAGMFADVAGAAYEAEKKALDAYATLTGAGEPVIAFNPADIIPLRNYISDKLGLYYDDERLNVLHHRLAPLAAANGLPTLSDLYLSLVNSPGSPDRMHKLAAQLTNNETYFFRETEQLREFVRSLLPEIVQKKSARKHEAVRVLSAGCSSGEEAYTIAMLLEEAGVCRSAGGMEVVGLDIDPDALATAQGGRYPERSFRAGNNNVVEKYFRRAGDLFVVHDDLRKQVRFVQGNLLEARGLGAFDAIFCRNVLIYFSDASMERVAANFYDMLIPGGYLLLGHSESFCRINTDFVPLRLDRAVAYQKAQ